jgi:hypothetical protein
VIDQSITRGDVVEVFRYVLDGFRVTDDWKAAVVERVRYEQIEVKALKGTFDGTHEYMALYMRHRGKTWR